ncbi:MAG: Zn-dependent oligopeptidase [Deltaproteobacteria bacterium]|nr:Zn-dependent oligopeptidase [Deltaproteobacteria bacterium]
MRLRLEPLFLLALAVGPACSPKDSRIPHEIPPPTVPNVPAPVVPDVVTPAPAAADTVQPSAPDAAAPAGDVVAADAATDAGPAEKPAEVDLGDGIEEARALLESEQWADAAALTRACDRSIARAELVRKRFASGDANVAGDKALNGLDEIALALDTIDGYASLLFNVSPVKEVRDEAEKCKTAIAKIRSDVSLDKSIFEGIVKVPREGLDAATTHFLDTSLRSFRLSGVDKDDATRARIAEINDLSTKLGQEYQKNVNGDTRKVELDVADLDGLPDDWKAQHPKNEAGKVVVTTDYPDLIPFLTYATSATARMALQEQNSARGFPANAEVLQKLLNLRAELAKLIGYPNFAALDLADKMAGTPEVVESFLAEAKGAAKPRVDSDLAELLARKKKDDKTATEVTVADRFYLQQTVRKEKLGFDAKTVRPYFAYPKVRDGILALYSELFGVEFAKREGVKAWDPSVEAWEMKRDGKVIGRFFLDMHPRVDKYKHAAMFPVQTGFVTTAGAPFDRLPWASLVCNFPNPADGDALMEHKDVVTFFHEFGHLIHHLLAQQSKWLSTSGINVEWDFVEAPSQLLEEWAWDAKVLARFAKDKDGKVIPPKVVEKMRKAEEFGKGVELARQLFYAAYSYYLHAADVTGLDLDAWTSKMYADWSPYPRPTGDRLYTNFAHLIGYKSAYYTYQWSLAIAKDLFGRFKEKGLLDKGVAHDYTSKVLEPAGTDKAENLVKAFLGRERNLDAYRAWIVK